MCEKFLAAGFNVEWKDVKTKLNNLTKKYKNEIKKRGPSQWHHFAKVHRILSAEKPINLEEYVLDSMDPDEGKWDRFMSFISDSSDSYSEDSSVIPESSESESFEPCGSAGPPAKK
ncbi:uncharacterized protein LOC117565968 isoform X1 [Drosophila albomicans]|uniref:Uncharacterized protein LOC117565968 isoform X1 n=1 Tax=Drosophila albomicans TaxID=7291 RepID=A0A9C6SYN1_DROAB|nr:uncharacterized protein LOC117565968 isoform X1 [Drosophila albomicans]